MTVMETVANSVYMNESMMFLVLKIDTSLVLSRETEEQMEPYSLHTCVLGYVTRCTSFTFA